MKIRTKYQTNAQGRSQILAKGGGKQRTTTYDPSKSSDWNHGNGAGSLAIALVASELPGTASELHQRFADVAAQDWQHESSEDGVTHVFTF